MLSRWRSRAGAARLGIAATGARPRKHRLELTGQLPGVAVAAHHGHWTAQRATYLRGQFPRHRQKEVGSPIGKPDRAPPRDTTSNRHLPRSRARASVQQGDPRNVDRVAHRCTRHMRLRQHGKHEVGLPLADPGSNGVLELSLTTSERLGCGNPARP
jgi:hypothetical protein